MTRLTGAVLLLLAVFPASVRAAGPEDTIRWVYASLASRGAAPKGLAYLAAGERRGQYFTRRMVDWFAVDDTYRAENLPGCWPHMFDVPSAEFDAAEINRTLTLTSTYAQDRQTVTASFSSLGVLARITYSFIAEDGFLKIDDVSGPGWQVSRIACQPWDGSRAASGNGPAAAQTGESGASPGGPMPAYTGGAAQFCYATSGDHLRLEVEADGSAHLSLVSRQPTGHVCETEGKARWTGRGWLHEPELEGADCALQILLTPDRGLRLKDPDYECKTVLCGPRAILDGLQFSRGDQIDCAFLKAD